MEVKPFDVDYVKEYIEYSETSPSCLIWKKDASLRSKKGGFAGTLTKRGYYVVRVRDRLVYAHRVVWVLFHFEIDNLDIDHKDRDKSNNKIGNLRLVSRSINLQNKSSRSKTGVKYLCWIEDRSRYDLRCEHAGVNTRFTVKEFGTKENAMKAAIEYLNNRNLLEYSKDTSTKGETK